MKNEHDSEDATMVGNPAAIRELLARSRQNMANSSDKQQSASERETPKSMLIPPEAMRPPEDQPPAASSQAGVLAQVLAEHAQALRDRANPGGAAPVPARVAMTSSSSSSSSSSPDKASFLSGIPPRQLKIGTMVAVGCALIVSVVAWQSSGKQSAAKAQEAGPAQTRPMSPAKSTTSARPSVTPLPTAVTPAAAVAPSAEIALASTPPGATVWYDGQERGNTPLSVPRGAALVLVKAGNAPLKMKLAPDSPDTIDLTMPPAPAIASGPAILRVECATKQRFPVILNKLETGHLCSGEPLRLRTGRHEVKIYKPAEDKYVSRVVVLRKGTATVKFTD